MSQYAFVKCSVSSIRRRINAGQTVECLAGGIWRPVAEVHSVPGWPTRRLVAKERGGEGVTFPFVGARVLVQSEAVLSAEDGASNKHLLCAVCGKPIHLPDKPRQKRIDKAFANVGSAMPMYHAECAPRGRKGKKNGNRSK